MRRLSALDLALKLVGGRSRLLARRFAIAVAKIVEQDGEHPRATIRTALELMKEAVRTQHRFLQQVVGVVGIARQPDRHRVQGVEMRQRLVFESLAPIRAGAALVRHMLILRT